MYHIRLNKTEWLGQRGKPVPFNADNMKGYRTRRGALAQWRKLCKEDSIDMSVHAAVVYVDWSKPTTPTTVIVGC